MVMALFLFTNALSALLGIVLTPAINDPTLVWAWAGPGVALLAQTAIFWWRHRSINDDEYMTNEDHEEVAAAESATPPIREKALESDEHDFAEKKL